MNNQIKILLFTFIGICTIALITYGVLSSKKLDEHKEKKVTSNINDYLYDETKDTIDLEEDEEDLDGDEVVDEDDDFEEYKEDNSTWGDEDSEEGQKEEVAAVEKKPVVSKPKNDDDELEPLYDNTTPSETKTPEKEPRKPKVEKSTSQPFLVIAGSFKSKRNAGKKIKALKKAGITGEIIQFKDSKLQTVVAGRFKTESAAEDFAEEMKSAHKLKAIVKEQ